SGCFGDDGEPRLDDGAEEQRVDDAPPRDPPPGDEPMCQYPEPVERPRYLPESELYRKRGVGDGGEEPVVWCGSPPGLEDGGGSGADDHDAAEVVGPAAGALQMAHPVSEGPVADLLPGPGDPLPGVGDSFRRLFHLGDASADHVLRFGGASACSAADPGSFRLG